MGFNAKALMYHSVGYPPKEAKLKSLYLSPKRFKNHIKALKLFGYSFLDSKDFLRIKESFNKSTKNIIITFDDAYLDIFENALPFLIENNIKAIVFVPTGLIGKYNTWDSHILNVKKPIADINLIREFSNLGIEFGSHTITHPYLTQISKKEAFKEIKDSKKMLEDIIGKEVLSFCYPYGDLNESIVESAGYKLAFTTESGHIKPDDDLFLLKRLHIRHNTNLFRLIIKLSKLYQ